MTQSVLILGARGRFGRHAATAFENAGWHVRRFECGRDDLKAEVANVDVVVNGWNPPNYSKWAREMMPLHRSVIEAARDTRACVILPGNVYVFGRQTGAPWSDTTPHQPENALGQLRVDVETAYRASGVQTIILRAGDFLDTQASLSWFDKVMTARLARGTFTYPGAPDVQHAWGFLPDLGRAAVALAEQRSQLKPFTDVCFPGFTLTGDEIAKMLSEIIERPVTLKQMAWWPLRILAPVWPMLRGLAEMRYLWDTPHSLDAKHFETLLPGFRMTSPAAALEQVIAQGKDTAVVKVQGHPA